MPETYLRSILGKYSSAAKMPLIQQAYPNIESILTALAGRLPHEVAPSGSFAKGTSISVGTDLDIFFCLTQHCTSTLSEIFYATKSALETAGYTVREQNVSLRINYGSLKCDIVPSKKQSGNTTASSLFKRKANSWTLTDVPKHIKLVSNSGRIEEIKLMKIWAYLNGLDVPSFYLELFILQHLLFSRYGDLQNNIPRVLTALRDKILLTRLVDPGNTNNIVSNDLTIAEKKVIAQKASASLNGNWGQFVY